MVRTVAPGAGRQPRVTLVVGAGFAHRPWRDAILAGLRAARIDVAVQAGPPTPASVARLAGQVREHRADVVVAVGGGSVLDAGKCAAVLSSRPRPDPALVATWCATGVPDGGLPTVAVPTTPGTGAEVTPFATVWDLDAGRKLSLRGPVVRPAAAILDPDLLRGLPAAQLASCLLDALAQGMEATWSIRADERAEAFGLTAVGRLAELLDAGGRVGDRLRGVGGAQRHAMLLAGHESGRAIAIAGTTVCHALSYPITLRYGLPHGQACGLTLARVLRYNAAVDAGDCADPRGPHRVHAAVDAIVTAAGATDAADLARRVDAFLAGTGLATPDLAAGAAVVAAQACGYDRAGNNPRRVDPAGLARLLTT